MDPDRSFWTRQLNLHPSPNYYEKENVKKQKIKDSS